MGLWHRRNLLGRLKRHRTGGGGRGSIPTRIQNPSSLNGTLEMESEECRVAPLLVQARGPRPGGARNLTCPVWSVPESPPGRRFWGRCCHTIPPRNPKAIRHYRQDGKRYLAWCLPIEKKGRRKEKGGWAGKRIRDNNPLANTARSYDWCIHNSVSSITSSLYPPTIGIMKL